MDATKQPKDPAKHKHPEKVGQVMHRWKYGTLHSGTGVKGEHRGPVDYGPENQKQAIAIALSIAGKGRSKRKAGRRRTVRSDSISLPARLQVAGVTVDVREDGTGTLVGPYGVATPYEAVVGTDPGGLWEVMDASGDWFAVVGVEDGQQLRSLCPDGRIRRLDSVDLAAMGIRCDVYGEGQA